MWSCSRSRGKGRREGGREGSDDVSLLFSNSGCTFFPIRSALLNYFVPNSNYIIMSKILLPIHHDIMASNSFTVVSFAVDNIQRLDHVDYLLCKTSASTSLTRLRSHQSIVLGSKTRGKPESCLDFNLVLCRKVLKDFHLSLYIVIQS